MVSGDNKDADMRGKRKSQERITGRAHELLVRNRQLLRRAVETDLRALCLPLFALRKAFSSYNLSRKQ